MTATITQRGQITCVGDKVRIEQGPVRRREVATEELLHDRRTAAHYKVGEPDAAGVKIELGKEMEFLEWGTGETASVLTHYVYLRKDRTKGELAETEDARSRIKDAIAEEQKKPDGEAKQTRLRLLQED